MPPNAGWPARWPAGARRRWGSTSAPPPYGWPAGAGCRRGVPALRRDVFGPLPAEGRWRRLLLADGNIGIGGDPERLLRRCHELAAPDGRILVEADPPCTPSWAGRLRILHTWTEAGRWFTGLSRA